MDYLLIIEWTAVLFNITYVVLAWYQKKSCWIFGAIGSGLSVYYFQTPEIRLYSESFLYSFYVVIAIYGWVTWSRPDHREVHEIVPIKHFLIVFTGFILAFLLSKLTGTYTDASRPFEDSLSTVFGIVATFLTIRKVLSNWIYWIFIDLFSVWLYIVRESDVYAAQMVIFSVLAYIGYIKWKKEHAVLTS